MPRHRKKGKNSRNRRNDTKDRNRADVDWWRKNTPKPEKKEERKIHVPSQTDLQGSFVSQVAGLLNTPLRLRQSVNSAACRIACIIRSFVPDVEAVRRVDLSPILGYQWALLALEVCPITGNVYIGGHNTPVLYVAPDDPNPRWLCGRTWKENGVQIASDQSSLHSATVTSIEVSSSGLVIFTVYDKKRNATPVNEDSICPGGIYTGRPGITPQKINLRENGKEVRLNNLRVCALSADERFLLLVSETDLYKVAFDEQQGQETGVVMQRAALNSSCVKCILLPHSGMFALFDEHQHVYLVDPELRVVSIPMKLVILSACVIRNQNTSSVVLHSASQIHVACEEVFTESFKDQKLKERLEKESSLLPWSKNILIDVPLLGFDQKNKQLVTDVDSRVLSWLDLY